MRLCKPITDKKQIISTQRIHISRQEIKYVHDCSEQQDNFKPRGLWYAFGAEWMDFVEYEMGSDITKYPHIYSLTVNNKNVLSLKTLNDVITFTDTFVDNSIGLSYFNLIDWTRVCKQYSGIEIPNYHSMGIRNSFDLHSKLFWLYPWDVSSGCIWKPNGILKINDY